ncbi:UNVERIFIED_CONTAM: Retrovirus-related Pol polyprotein from transposon TNT 1-94 [Sesamum radiatum]|uniref:Retrovirus-related Pol polyprotein from transposon TNT 1-94 n=1 Tax=Sesamum radiatum TaxID=300843 RepID=A0AAW2IJ27_SESRA
MTVVSPIRLEICCAWKSCSQSRCPNRIGSYVEQLGTIWSQVLSIDVWSRMRTVTQFHALDRGWETVDGRTVPVRTRGLNVHSTFHLVTMRHGPLLDGHPCLAEGEPKEHNITERNKGLISSVRRPQVNGVAERRNRTLFDMVRSMMSFTELPPSFCGHALETAVKLLNILPFKSIPQMPYEIWHGKPAYYKYLRVWGSPEYVKRLVGDKLDSRSSLCRSTRESRVPERYEFVWLTSRLDNDPKTYGEAMSDIDSDKWLEAMKSEMDSMGSNQVWTLVDPPKGVRPIGCKWVYKRKLGADWDVTAFKARLLAKGYTQRPGVDFEEIYSPVAMAKSIQILLAIAAWSIYGPKQDSRSWNTRFDEVIRGYDFIKNDYDPCVYKKISGSSVTYFVLYVDDILLIGNDVKMLGDIKAWLSTQFSMKHMGEASYILGIKIYRDRSRRMLGLTQSLYIEKVLKRFRMEHSKRGVLPIRHGIKLSKKQSSKTDEELKRMSDIPYASAVGSIQYVVQCTRPDVAYALSVTSRYQAYTGEGHWSSVKSIIKYLRRTKDMFLIYGGGELILEGYSDASFQSDDDDAKSQSGFVFKLNSGVVAWKSFK